MKAVRFAAYGGFEVLEVVDTPEPVANRGQLLVEVHAVSINPIDFKVRAGYLKEMVPLQLPVTTGGDFAGIVRHLGENTVGYKVGDQVFGQALVLNGGSGSFAEIAAVNTANCALKPWKTDFPESAALPLAGSSALQALEEHMKLGKSQKVLIHGGTGGIGHLAIQVAKSMGAHVATTVSGKSKDFAKELGADEVIDYRSQAFEKMLTDFDAVLDTIGGETGERSFQVLRKGGVLVSMTGQPSPALAEKYGVTAIGQITRSDTAELRRLADLVDSGSIKVQIDSVFHMGQAREAFAHMEQESPRGKVVLRIRD